MFRLVKNHRNPGSNHSANGIIDGDGDEHVLAETVFDNRDKYQGQWHHGGSQGVGVYDWFRDICLGASSCMT